MRGGFIHCPTEAVLFRKDGLTLTVNTGAAQLTVTGVQFPGAIQIRISEALTILPVFTPAAIPGVPIGCLLFNLTSGLALPLDFLVGTLATLLAAWGMWLSRRFTIKGYPLLGLLMPVITNAVLVGWELSIYIGGAFWLNALYVAIGEAAVLLTLGSALYYALKNRNLHTKLFA